MAAQNHPAGKPPEGAGRTAGDEAGKSQDVELLKIEVSRTGQTVNAHWAIHPQIKHDLLPDEWKEVSDLMAKVTGIVGHRFSEVLRETEPDKPGTA